MRLGAQGMVDRCCRADASEAEERTRDKGGDVTAQLSQLK